MICALCNESMRPEENFNKGQPMHRECGLRSTLGGVGHMLDHDHFCIGQGDPDAGLPFRLSALLVSEMVKYWGVEEAVERSNVPLRPNDPVA